MFLRRQHACIPLILLAACGKDEGTVLGPNASAASLRIAPDPVTMTAIGDTVRLAAEVRDANDQLMTTPTVNWKSLNGTVATVSISGLVEATGSGVALVAASAGSVADTVVVTVGPVAVSVEVSPVVASVAKGDTLRFTAAVRDANGHEIQGAPLLWSSADETIGTVVNSGLVTASMKGGQTEISATSGAATGVATLTVLDELLFVTDRDGNDEIYQMRSDGEHQTNLTKNDAADTDPEWSPDGTRVAFTSDRVTGLDIVVMNADGGAPMNLTETASGTDFEPAWSPDGTRIAFRSTRTLDFEVYLMNADGTGVINLSNSTGADREPIWSPLGTKIAFISNRDGNDEIYAVNPDGSGPTNLSMAGKTDVEHAWSADGTKIAFRSFRTGNQDIYVMDANGSNPLRLTTAIAFDGAPIWSPDGTKIAFVTTRDGNEEIYVMNPDGTGQVNLTNSAGNDDQPAWSPDGTKLAFRSDRDGNSEIYVMNSDGSDAIRLTNDPADDRSPAWRPLR